MVYLIIIFLILYWLFELRCTYVEHLDYKFGLNIYQVSDFHSSAFVDLNRLDKILSCDNIDVVILTGDMVSRTARFFDRFERFLKIVYENSKEVVFVTGNHELENRDYLKIIEILKKHEIKILDNSYIIIENTLISNVDISEVKEEFKYSIFADHFPINCEGKSGYDLRVCGHTHGGQVRLPFVGAIIDHDKNIFPKNQKGLYKKNNNLIYIDSGIGSRIPIRIFNRSKVTRISRR